MKLYIAGPMTGLPAYNYPAFNTAAAALRQAGYEAVSPTDNGLPPDAEWAAHMRRDLPMMLACDGVALLPGWEVSRGAILESETAITCGIPSQPLHFWLRAGQSLARYCTPTNPATHPAPPPKTTPTTKAPA